MTDATPLTFIDCSHAIGRRAIPIPYFIRLCRSLELLAYQGQSRQEERRTATAERSMPAKKKASYQSNELAGRFKQSNRLVKEIRGNLKSIGPELKKAE